jgi:POT family proton-dependent oligopeptide transporter
MLLGLIVFVLGKPWLQGKGEAPDPVRLKQPVFGPVNREWLVYLVGLLGVAVVYFIIPNHDLVGTGLLISTVLALAYIGYVILFQLKGDKIARERMMLAVVPDLRLRGLLHPVRAGGIVAEPVRRPQRGSRRHRRGLHLRALPVRHPGSAGCGGGAAGRIWIDTGITAAQTQSFNAGFILIFAPIFAAMWASLARNGRDPNPVMKFGLALIQVGLGFLVVVWGVNAGMVNEAFRTPLIMLLFLYLLHTTGELFLSPVGLSQITKLSVASIVSFMMAVWFMASAIAHFVGGQIAAAAGTETVGGQVLDPRAALNSSIESFNMLGWWGVGLGVAFIAGSFFIKHWAHGADDTHTEGDKPVPTGFAPTPDGERQVTDPTALPGGAATRSGPAAP